MNYKTEEMMDGKIDIVFHENLAIAADWMKAGINVRLFRQDGVLWIESGTAELELL